MCQNRTLNIKISYITVENSLLAQNKIFSKGVKICILTIKTRLILTIKTR